MFSIHISDWNERDRVLFYKNSDEVLKILTDKSKTPRDRMSEIYR